MSTRESIPLPVQILLTISLAVFGLVGGFIFWAFMMLTGFPIYIQVLLLLAGAVLILFLILKIFRIGKPRPVNFTFLSIILVLLLAAGGFQAYRLYDRSISTVGDEVDLWNYIPFPEYAQSAAIEENMLIPRQEASLRLSSELPRLDGATALYPVYAAVTEAVYPEGDYTPPRGDGTVVCNTTPEAYDRLIRGDADLIFVLGPSERQLETARKEGVELEITPLGREAFVFFVNGKNPVTSLTKEQLRKIYSGKISNWSELGGKDDPIRAFQRPENSGSQTALQKMMGETPLMQPLETEVISGMGEILHRTSDYKNYQNAIGYSFRFFATEMAADNQIRLLEVDGVYPNRDTIRDGSYPVVMEFCAVTRKGGESGNTKKLKEWLLSPDGQALIEQTGYLPL